MPRKNEGPPQVIKAMSIADIESEIALMEAEIAPALARLRELKVCLRNKKGAAASAKARADKAPAAAVRTARKDIDGRRGFVPQLMEAFGVSERTIHRKLGPRQERDE